LAGVREEGLTVPLPLDQISLSRVVSAVSPDLLGVAEGNDRVARVLRRSFRKVVAERDVVLNFTLSDIAGRR
ncbi:MAG TPA: hypothetical protein VKH46_04350, partial [Thermoanaerobaculia bacterium]|nr:hypothetical protein [Thermoanaerobaculia bacterium]